MSRYYQADDRVFQKLREQGKTSWDEQADPQASFDKFVMRPFLEEALAAMAGPLAGQSALEIGCGSGPISCFLAGRGLAVRGIDVSPTALEMARQHAAQRGLTIQFDLADICNMSVSTNFSGIAFPGGKETTGRKPGATLTSPPECYDLIVDGHCLHYLVLDEHRQAALAAIYRMLKPGGLFLMDTMIAHAGLVVGANYRINAQGVLSIKVDDPTGREGAFESDGRWFAMYRRLLMAEQVVKELRGAGLAIQYQRTISQADPRKPMMMQIKAGRERGLRLEA